MNPIYNQFDTESNQILNDLILILERKFVKLAWSNEVLVIKADAANDKIVACVAKNQDIPGSLEVNTKLEHDLEPYFNLLKDKFKPQVVAEFIHYHLGQSIYIKDVSGIVTQQLIQRVKDPAYPKNKNQP